MKILFSIFLGSFFFMRLVNHYSAKLSKETVTGNLGLESLFFGLSVWTGLSLDVF